MPLESTPERNDVGRNGAPVDAQRLVDQGRTEQADGEGALTVSGSHFAEPRLRPKTNARSIDMLAEFARILKPGGRYVLVTWCNNDALNPHPPEAAAIDEHYHCHTHRRTTYLRALIDAGLTPLPGRRPHRARHPVLGAVLEVPSRHRDRAAVPGQLPQRPRQLHPHRLPPQARLDEWHISCRRPPTEPIPQRDKSTQTTTHRPVCAAQLIAYRNPFTRGNLFVPSRSTFTLMHLGGHGLGKMRYGGVVESCEPFPPGAFRLNHPGPFRRQVPCSAGIRAAASFSVRTDLNNVRGSSDQLTVETARSPCGRCFRKIRRTPSGRGSQPEIRLQGRCTCQGNRCLTSVELCGPPKRLQA